MIGFFGSGRRPTSAENNTVIRSTYMTIGRTRLRSSAESRNIYESLTPPLGLLQALYFKVCRVTAGGQVLANASEWPSGYCDGPCAVWARSAGVFSSATPESHRLVSDVQE